ncbi:MAG: hypothetical protein Solumvirus1_30 [Solumvirus sp.]|uniref:Uncharacterized protein n=1 Tax=Solumvirus sp. TaxID=2487773 RepID=A0A3G5AG15_9VIRU|nr:MAG: hypothetical protein Solumvirus1_30 [Solumvirus sp.]
MTSRDYIATKDISFVPLGVISDISDSKLEPILDTSNELKNGGYREDKYIEITTILNRDISSDLKYQDTLNDSLYRFETNPAYDEGDPWAGFKMIGYRNEDTRMSILLNKPINRLGRVGDVDEDKLIYGLPSLHYPAMPYIFNKNYKAPGKVVESNAGVIEYGSYVENNDVVYRDDVWRCEIVDHHIISFYQKGILRIKKIYMFTEDDKPALEQVNEYNDLGYCIKVTIFESSYEDSKRPLKTTTYYISSLNNIIFYDRYIIKEDSKVVYLSFSDGLTLSMYKDFDVVIGNMGLINTLERFSTQKYLGDLFHGIRLIRYLILDYADITNFGKQVDMFNDLVKEDLYKKRVLNSLLF